MSTLKAPFPYFGGKSQAAGLVWDRLGDVKNYVEPFFGSGAVLLGRPHDPRIETVNDLDGLLCNFWRAVQAAPDEVAKVADWPVSECDLHARHLVLVDRRKGLTDRLIADPYYCDATLAGWWVWGACAWIGSGWCSGEGPSRQASVTTCGSPSQVTQASTQCLAGSAYRGRVEEATEIKAVQTPKTYDTKK